MEGMLVSGLDWVCRDKRSSIGCTNMKDWIREDGLSIRPGDGAWRLKEIKGRKRSRRVGEKVAFQ